MTGVVEIPFPGVSGPQHLLIPDSRARWHPYATPTDVSRILPPLTLNTPDGFRLKTSSNTQPFGSSGVPSPPSSDCSQNYSSQTRRSVTEDCPVSPAVGRLTPPYHSPRPWSSPANHTISPHPSMPEQAAYEVPFNNLAVRPHTQQQLQQQQAYYAPPYHGGPAMPAPSSLLGSQIAQAPVYPQSRSVLTYQALPPPPSSSTQEYREYSATSYDESLYSAAGYPFLAAPSFPSHPFSYPQAYGQPQMWELQTQHRRPAKSTSVYGPLARADAPVAEGILASTNLPLAQKVWERVFEHLRYADRLRLQSVNRFWAKALKKLNQQIKDKPTDAEFAEMQSVVLQAENYRKHWPASLSPESKVRCGRPRSNARQNPPLPQLDEYDDDGDNKGKKAAAPAAVGNIGCYHCFTVQPPEKFCLLKDDVEEDGEQQQQNGNTSTRIGRDGYLGIRRYCIDCGIKKGFHPSNKYLERKWGIEIWICCGTINEHGVMNCPKCRRGCPLTPVNKSSRRSSVKRSSAMPPPASRAQKQHRMPDGQGYPLYQAQFQGGHSPQGWS